MRVNVIEIDMIFFNFWRVILIYSIEFTNLEQGYLNKEFKCLNRDIIIVLTEMNKGERKLIKKIVIPVTIFDDSK